MNIDIPLISGYLLGFIISLCFHEWAHAYVAYRFGDSTAESEGRMTLNPFAHIDPLGTIILPLAGMIFKLPLLGWAKPVPVDLRNVRGDKRFAHMMIAAAGPATNLVLCVIFAFLLELLIVFGLVDPSSFFFPLLQLLNILIHVNAILAFFNLIPMPPLDGGAIIAGLLPEQLAHKFESALSQFGFIILFSLLILGGLSWVSSLSNAYVSMVKYCIKYLL